MKLLVVILNYRVTDLTIECLRSISPEISSVPGMRVAVCENGTGDDSEERLRTAIVQKAWGHWAELTAVYPNLGFTGGNNVILRKWLRMRDAPEYFLLLNADTVVRAGAFKALVNFMDCHPEAGIAGSRLEWPDGSNQSSPFRFPGIVTELDRGLRLGIFSKLVSPWAACIPTPSWACRVDWVSGASMIIRRQVLEAVGLLDEGLYTYFDDVDFCLNAKRAGWETWFVPESRVIHLEGASTGIVAKSPKRRPAYWFQARRRFFLKNYGRVYTAFADAAFLIGFAFWRLRRRLQRKPDDDPPYMLRDSIWNSVFITGFTLREVQNPAMRTR